jgi:hypothetical protein
MTAPEPSREDRVDALRTAAAIARAGAYGDFDTVAALWRCASTRQVVLFELARMPAAMALAVAEAADLPVDLEATLDCWLLALADQEGDDE